MLSTCIKRKYHAQMQLLTALLIDAGLAGRVVSHAQVVRLAGGTAQRCYSLVNRALRYGELMQLRRGLYVVAPTRQVKLPHPFVLAQAVQPGSYVSFETALGFHGWIPEAVSVTMSVLPGRRQLALQHAALGQFCFMPLALQRGQFLVAVDRQHFAGQVALVAQPLRALFDMACVRKLSPAAMLDLVPAMRIDPALLAQLPSDQWQAVQGVYAHRRMAQNVASLLAALTP
jgi:hypothetical protein